jgi:DnaJ-class molecular chaperone
MNYYEMLNIDKNASKEEIVQAFRKMIKTCHPDRIKDKAEKQMAEEKFQQITEAFNILKDDAKRKEYDEKLESGADDSGEADALATQYFKNGLHQLNNEGNFRLAEEFFKKAVHLDKTNAKYFYYLGLAQSEEPKKQREAVANLAKAMELDPFLAKYPALIGTIYLKSGMNTRAIKYFEKALELDDNNKEALEGMQALGKGKRQSFWAKIFSRK